MARARSYGEIQRIVGDDTSVPRFFSNLPLFRIKTAASAGFSNTDVNITVDVLPAAVSSQSYADVIQSFTGTGAWRGNTSNVQFGDFKHQYKIEPSAKISILGFPSFDKWVLQGEVFDRSFMRNHLVYTMTRNFGIWAARTQKCEVTIDGEYKGIFTFQESLDKDVNRINIATNSVTTDPNKGYIFGRDHYGDSFQDPADVYTLLGAGDAFLIKYPKAKSLKDINGDITTNGQIQIDYLHGLIVAADNAINGGNYTDSAIGWRAHLDEDAIAIAFIMNEWSKGYDSWANSTFFYRTTSGKFKWVPWDYDYSFGDVTNTEINDPEGWLIHGATTGTAGRLLWIHRIWNDMSFRATVATKWKAARNTFMSNAAINAMYDGMLALLEGGPSERDEQRWAHQNTPRTMGDPFLPKSFRNQIEIDRAWTHDRNAWIDGQLP